MFYYSFIFAQLCPLDKKLQSFFVVAHLFVAKPSGIEDTSLGLGVVCLEAGQDFGGKVVFAKVHEAQRLAVLCLQIGELVKELGAFVVLFGLVGFVGSLDGDLIEYGGVQCGGYEQQGHKAAQTLEQGIEEGGKNIKTQQDGQKQRHPVELLALFFVAGAPFGFNIVQNLQEIVGIVVEIGYLGQSVVESGDHQLALLFEVAIFGRDQSPRSRSGMDEMDTDVFGFVQALGVAPVAKDHQLLFALELGDEIEQLLDIGGAGEDA